MFTLQHCEQKSQGCCGLMLEAKAELHLFDTLMNVFIA